MSEGPPGVPPGGVESPCIGLCMMNDTLGYCLGCGRTRAEIARWSRLAGDERLEVIGLAQARSGLTLVKPDKPEEA